TLSSSSVIDLLGTDVLHFAASNLQTWTGTLSIWNWNGIPATGGGAEQLLFGTDATGLTGTQLAEIVFYSDSGITQYGGPTTILSTGEVVPIPEPGTWISASLAFSALLFTQRRRFSRLVHRA